jgi:hypothetical protein
LRRDDHLLILISIVGSISINKGTGLITDFAITPLAHVQKPPNAVVIPDLDIEVLEIGACGLFNLLLLNEQDGTIETDAQVWDEPGIEWDIIATEIKHIG